MKFSKLLYVLPVLFFAVAAQAQQKGRAQFNVQYTAGLPTGSFKNTLSEKSFRGVQGSILYGISNKLAVGLGTGFQDFYQKNPRQMFKLEDGSDLSAVRTYSIQTTPVLATAKYSFTPGAAVQPYAALGLGGTLVSYTDMLGEFNNEDKLKFGFGAKPEAGVFVPFRKAGESGFTLGASYNIVPFKQGDFTNLNHIGIHAGISVPLRK